LIIPEIEAFMSSQTKNEAKIMGTWSQPNTAKKAHQLKKLMSEPLLKNQACEKLYHLVGDDDLFDFIQELEPTDDVRYLVQSHIETTLNNLNRSFLKWEEDAIATCESLLPASAISLQKRTESK
jgi:hypothetical protein